MALDGNTWKMFEIHRRPYHVNICKLFVAIMYSICQPSDERPYVIQCVRVCRSDNFEFHGRQAYRTLIYTTSSRLSYYALSPLTADRGMVYTSLTRWAAGKVELNSEHHESYLISRKIMENGVAKRC